VDFLRHISPSKDEFAVSKASMTLRNYIIGLTVIASAFVQCKNKVPSSKGAYGTLVQPIPTSSSGQLKLGEPVTLTNVRIRITSQRRCSSPEPFVPKTGNQLWAAEVELTNTSNRIFFVNPFHLTLSDARKNEFVTSLIGCSPVLESKPLAPGEQIRGFVPFELPQSIQAATLIYRPHPDTNREEIARFFVEL
jgi:hypothetical protein